MLVPMSERQENFSAALRRLRMANGLTQVELANAIGTTRRSILYFEAGGQIPGVRTWAKLREVLGPELPVP
jgi:transcriptional regulator with XRE-family HTH domain